MIKDCPDCFQEVLAEESQCPACGRDLAPPAPMTEEDWEPFI